MYQYRFPPARRVNLSAFPVFGRGKYVRPPANRVRYLYLDFETRSRSDSGAKPVTPSARDFRLSETPAATPVTRRAGALRSEEGA